jgi:hypothetical protein
MQSKQVRPAAPDPVCFVVATAPVTADASAAGRYRSAGSPPSLRMSLAIEFARTTLRVGQHMHSRRRSIAVPALPRSGVQELPMTQVAPACDWHDCARHMASTAVGGSRWRETYRLLSDTKVATHRLANWSILVRTAEPRASDQADAFSCFGGHLTKPCVTGASRGILDRSRPTCRGGR